MLDRTLAFSSILLLLSACGGQDDPLPEDGDLMAADETVDAPKADDPADDPAAEDPGADPAEPEDPAAAAAPSADCTVGWTYVDCHPNETTLTIDGDDREVLWRVPAGEPPEGGWPVVLAFHGTNDPASKVFSWSYYSFIDQSYGGYYQLQTTRDLLDAGFAVLAPKARLLPGGIYWDTNIPPYADNWSEGPDAAFMDQLLLEIAAGTFGPLDTGRQYAMGLSSGAYHSSRLAVAYPDQFRGVALQSGSYATCISAFPCEVEAADLPANHPPTLLMAGSLDAIVPLSTTEAYEDALVDNGTESTLEVVSIAGHQWTSSSPGWVLDWFQTH
ncbi:MAG: alpha/beta hydrolase-fold protein [Myxococcota bacterium]